MRSSYLTSQSRRIWPIRLNSRLPQSQLRFAVGKFLSHSASATQCVKRPPHPYKPSLKGCLAVISRAMSNMAKDKDTYTLPVLPPAPSYPCPFLTTEEIETYLTPLYARAWSVQPSDPGPQKKPTPELVTRFTCSTPEALNELLQALDEVTERENHHGVREVSTDPPALVLKVHTHTGLRPASSPEEPRRARVQPGITLRDVRFAYLLEEILDRIESPHAGRRGDVAADDQPMTAEAMEARRHSFTLATQYGRS